MILKGLKNLDCLLRTCAQCHGFWGLVSYFCPRCWIKFCLTNQDPLFLFRSEMGFPVYSLFAWKPDNDKLLRSFTYSHKGTVLRKSWHDIAAYFIQRRIALGPLGSKTHLVFAPSRFPKKTDHAFVFARELSKLCKLPVLDLFERQDITEQKQKSLADRKNVRFVLTMPLARHGRYIFVDDLYTTGSTALAAYKALNKPKNFEVWTSVRKYLNY